MKQILLFVLLFSMAAIGASAQNTVQSIRKAYGEVKEWIKIMEPDEDWIPQMPKECYELNVDLNLPGTGGHHERILMYFDELESPDSIIYKPHYLRFATTKYNYAAREFYEEYLFDSDGRLMFVYAYTPDAIGLEMYPHEFRMWFDGKRMLRFTVKKDGNEVYSGTTFPDKFRTEAERIKNSSKRMLELFKSTDANVYP